MERCPKCGNHLFLVLMTNEVCCNNPKCDYDESVTSPPLTSDILEDAKKAILEYIGLEPVDIVVSAREWDGKNLNEETKEVLMNYSELIRYNCIIAKYLAGMKNEIQKYQNEVMRDDNKEAIRHVQDARLYAKLMIANLDDLLAILKESSEES